MERFRPGLRQIALHLGAWKSNIVDATPQYVPVADWQPVQEALRRHVDFETSPPRAVAPVQGEAGVGKTRLVYEVVASIPGAESLVIYCGTGDNAVHVATELANDTIVSAVLIADECDVAARARIDSILAGHRDRVRVITIDNGGERGGGQQAELLLGKMPRDSLIDVLDANYRHVPPERRRAYAALAQGFPRLAASLCRDDALIASAGHVGPGVLAIHEYLRVSLTEEQREALAALALVTKAGYAGGVESELDQLCGMLDLPRPAVEHALHRIHDRQGFVARTGRYFYVTPEVVAQVAYEDAWGRWGRDAHAFFERVPNEMIQVVLDRAWRSAPEKVRRACAAYFRGWAAGTTPEQLRDVATVRRLVALADTYPADYLSRIRQLIAAASFETLASVRGEGPGDGSWGPRRALVWLAERFAQFPEFFDDAEQVLLRLAVAESEPKISNNATGIWCQLYRVYLSGTSVPFAERLARLRTRLFDAAPSIRALATAALEGVFVYHASRMLGPAVVGGRIPPADWRPRSAEEERDAFLGALDLLLEASGTSDDLRVAAVRIAVENTRWLIARGFLSNLRELLSSVDLPDDELSALIEQLDATLTYDYDGRDRRPQRVAVAGTPARDEIAGWRDTLSAQTFHTRIVASVGKDRWAASRVHAEVRTRETGSDAGDDLFHRELGALADEMLSTPDVLLEELEWLTSDAARSAADLGESIGRKDTAAKLLHIVLSAGEKGSSRLLARGYAYGLLAAHPEHAETVNRWLDAAEQRAPDTAADLAISAGQLARALERVLRMFDAGKLPATYLWDHNFMVGGGGEVPPTDLILILERLAVAAEAGDEVAERVGLDAFVTRLPYDTPPERPSLFAEHSQLAALAWRLLEARPAGSAPASLGGRQVVVALGRAEPARAAGLAGALLGSDDLRVAEEGETALIALASSHPVEVMEALGQAMLDEKRGWRFFVGEYHELIAALPVDVLRDWIQRAGVEGARRVARHLPQPQIGTDGGPVVWPLTHWVLEKFEADDRTFHEFCAGVHSLKLYSGDIAAEHEAEAALARRFMNHPLRRIREWAVLEERSALAEAQEARRWEEEADLP